MKYKKILKNIIYTFISIVFFILITASNAKENTVIISAARDGLPPWSLETSGYAEVTFANAVLKPILDIEDRNYIRDKLLKVHFDYRLKSYVFEIPLGLKFSNGRDVEANDVEFSFARYFLTTKRAESRMFLSSIQGIKKLKKGDKYKEGLVSGIKIINKHKLTIKLDAPNPAFMYSLACSWISVVPKEELNDDYVTWKKFPIGAGDYKVISVDRENRVTIKYIGKNPLPKNKPVQIIFDETPESYKTADIVAFSNINPDENRYKIEKLDFDLGNLSLYFNYRNKLANNVNFRKAVAYSIDRSNIIDKEGLYSISKSILTENLFYSKQNIRPYDLSVAKKYMRLVPKELLENPIKITLGLEESELSDFDKAFIERIKQNLLDIGIKSEVVPYKHLVFDDTDNDLVMKYDYRGNGLYDPLAFFNAFYKTDFLSNYFPRDKDSLDRYKILLYNAAHAESDDTKATSIGKLESYFYDNAIAIPLFGWKQFFWVKKDTIKTTGNFQSFSIDPSLILRLCT